jgi:peptidoglycan/LPS O-acetylase OafA/YrhL
MDKTRRIQSNICFGDFVMTLKESINHGYNLMVTAVLFFAGIAFGSIAFSPVENDWADRLDDIGLPLVGIACLIWFLTGRHRYQRSLVPLLLAGLALVVQIVAIPLERDDPAAFGDNIGGLIMLVPFFVFVLVYYLSRGRAPAAEQSEGPVQ